MNKQIATIQEGEKDFPIVMTGKGSSALLIDGTKGIKILDEECTDQVGFYKGALIVSED